VERFKLNWQEKDALHSRFDPFTGDLVTDDMSWGHLQVSYEGGGAIFVRMEIL